MALWALSPPRIARFGGATRAVRGAIGDLERSQRPALVRQPGGPGRKSVLFAEFRGATLQQARAWGWGPERVARLIVEARSNQAWSIGTGQG
jgi:hypothetical protein